MTTRNDAENAMENVADLAGVTPATRREWSRVFLHGDRLELDVLDFRVRCVLAREPENSNALRSIEAIHLAVGIARDLERSIAADQGDGLRRESPRTVQFALALASSRIQAGQLAVLAGAVIRS